MLIANFCNGKNKAIVSGAWQYDYGQRLYIHGLELPEVVEIGFSLTETGGMDYPRFAMTKDGVTEVAIPDEMMEGNDVESDYRIYAFVFVEDEKQESGQTVKSIEIRVKSRPKRWMDDETGDNFSEIVKGVDTYCIYPPHLFERYRERVLGQTYLSEMETIFKFFENDNGTFNSFTKNLANF